MVEFDQKSIIYLKNDENIRALSLTKKDILGFTIKLLKAEDE